MEEYGGNSYKQRNKSPKPEERKKVRTVTTGHEKKKSVVTKAADVFIKEDLDTAIKYVMTEKIIPGILSGTVDVIESVVEMIFLGERKSHSRDSRRSRTEGRPSYAAYYKSEGSGRKDEYVEARSYGRYTVKDIYVDSREDAKEIFEVLGEQIEEFGHCTVGDLYDAVSITGDNFVDRDWGWTTMHGFGTRPLRDGGYLLVTPKPECLK